MNTLTAEPVPLRHAAPPDPLAVSVAPVRGRRPRKFLLLGVLLILLGGLCGYALISASHRTVPVYVAAHRIDRGQTITVDDLTTLDLAPGQKLSGFTLRQSTMLIGKTATLTIPTGGIITTTAVATSLPVADGTAIVGLSLKPAQLPGVRLQPGDQVVLTPVAEQNSLTPTTSTDVTGIVVDAPTPNQNSGTTVVDVQVSRSVASDLAGRAAAGLVALYLTGGS